MTRVLTPHPFASDGIADPLRHVETCTCGLPRRHPRHTMPVVPREVVEVEARRVGEREPTEAPANVLPFRPRPDARRRGAG